MSMLAIFREVGSDRVQVLGLLVGGVRREEPDDDPDAPPEPASADEAVGPADVAAALDRGELYSVMLEEPGELIRIEGLAEGPVAGAAGYGVSHLVAMLPYGHHVVYVGMVKGHTVVPLEALDGADAVDPVVRLYQDARQRGPYGAAGGGKGRSRRVRLT